MADSAPTAAEVAAAVEAISTATTRARDLCRLYAQTETGWKPSDRLRHQRRLDDYRVEVVRFLGSHPNSWAITPLVECVRLRKDGTAGARKVLIEIDPDGNWPRRWGKV